MFKKIILIVVIIVAISGGTVVGLDKFNSAQLAEQAKKVEIEKEEYKKFVEATEEQIKNKDKKDNDTTVEINNPSNPNEVKKEWRGQDGLTYRVDAIKNENGTYTGEVVGFNMYDNFIEFNFKFTEITKRGFEDLLKK